MKIDKNVKIVLITGGSSGLGKSLGIYLSKKGYIVYGTSRNPSKYENFSYFELLRLDVGDASSIFEAVATIVDKHGRLDVLINNAGAGITGPIEEIPEEEILKNFSTNYFGAIKVTKAVLPQMRKQQNGLIIQVTSIAGYMGLPYRGIYSASKAALEITTEAWRMELKDFNIKMTSVAPGAFATNIAAGRYHAPVKEDSSYKEKYSMTLSAINQDVDAGKDPIELAKKIYKIINISNPKVHYRVGAFMQKFSVVLKKILPDKVYEKILMNHYKL